MTKESRCKSGIPQASKDLETSLKLTTKEQQVSFLHIPSQTVGLSTTSPAGSSKLTTILQKMSANC